MKRLLILLFAFLMVGCETTTKIETPPESDNQTTFEKLTLNQDYTIQRIRTDPKSFAYEEPYLKTFRDMSELMAYTERNTSKYQLSPFEEYAENYKQAKFEEHILLTVVTMETSGSIYHKMGDLYVENGNLYVELTRITPEYGTSDMATWHIMIEVSKQNYVFDDVIFIINDE